MNIDTGELVDIAKFSEGERATLKGFTPVPASLEQEARTLLAGKKQVQVTRQNSPALSHWAKMTRRQRRKAGVRTWKDFCN